MIFGYARCSTTHQDVAIQCQQLQALGVSDSNILVDEGLSASNRDRPGLRSALDRLRNGDTLVITKLDRLARSVQDAHTIASALHEKGVILQIGKGVYDPTDPLGKMLFTTTAMFAEFERDLISQRTKEGMARAKKAGRLKGKRPKLTKEQERQVIKWIQEGEITQAEMARILGVSPATITRTRKRLIDNGHLT